MEREIIERLHSIEKVLERNTATLEEHIRRTEAAEENIELLRSDVRAIERHIISVQGVGKFIAFSSLVAGLVATILKLIE